MIKSVIAFVPHELDYLAVQSFSKLVIGQKAEDVIGKLEGIRCGFRNTSCPDQLAKALKQAIGQ